MLIRRAAPPHRAPCRAAGDARRAGSPTAPAPWFGTFAAAAALWLGTAGTLMASPAGAAPASSPHAQAPHAPSRKASARHAASPQATARRATAGRVKSPVVTAQADTVTAADGPDRVLGYGERADVLQFVAGIAERSGIDADWLRGALTAARYQPSVARFIMPPPAGVAKNWAAYRDRFVEPVRIRAGVAFWQANQSWLTLAEQRYGVPPAIVVGIVGVETIYGRQMGSYRIIDALATLSFDFPAGRKDRSAFFRDELEQYLLLCRRADADPLAARGSYAGAMGLPQFMPSSVNRYAVDFDGDGRIDLNASAADAIGSVAHYLAEFGWQRGLPTHVAVAPPVDAADRAFLLGPDILPSFGVQTFADRGARLDGVPAGFDGLLALVELQNGDAAPSYVAGTANFYAITRYNWSSYYAMAVITLGDAVMRRVNAVAAAASPAATDGRTLR